MKVSQHLWFEKDMESAIRFYVSLIPGSELKHVSPMPADSPSGPAGSVLVADFRLGDQDYQAIEAGPMEEFNHRFSVMVQVDTQDEIDELWDALSEGGSTEQCGWLRDRWGLCWQIVPKRLEELMGDPDRAKAKRVTEAMLRMEKFDISALEAAARG
jgi:predicted 3-demethylubiquinone-9 3-methyltransferase (glyoxalase superfamily)